MKRLLMGGVLALMPVIAAAEVDSVLRPVPSPRLLAHPVIDPLVPGAEGAGLADAAVSGGVATVPPVMGPQERDMTTRLPTLGPSLRPRARIGTIPRTRWQHMRGHAIWTRSAISALKAHGKPLVDTVPKDIDIWCPAYASTTDDNRRAFWVGFLSALAKYESTYKAGAVGGGGRWFGLLQIYPRTARGYNCTAGSGEGLKNGAANLSCAVRIMARTVPRDGVIYGRGGRGVAADWGPLRSAPKRAEMARWLRRQPYCTPVGTVRPKARP